MRSMSQNVPQNAQITFYPSFSRSVNFILSQNVPCTIHMAGCFLLSPSFFSPLGFLEHFCATETAALYVSTSTIPQYYHKTNILPHIKSYILFIWSWSRTTGCSLGTETN